jgi:hypothetical protein
VNTDFISRLPSPVADTESRSGGPLEQPANIPDVQCFGCPEIIDLSYGLFLVGNVWKTRYLAEQATRLEKHLQSALEDATLNSVFDEYKQDAKVQVTAKQTARHIIEIDWPSVVDRDLLQRLGQGLLSNGQLPESGLESYALTMVLPPGTILLDKMLGVTSMNGQASIHGAFTLNSDGKDVEVYFCAAVWSDGSNGVAIPAFTDPEKAIDRPAWLPWENTCAALYHEIAELRTNKNIDHVPYPLKPGSDVPKSVGWGVIYRSPYYPTGFAEVPDLPIGWAETFPQKVFCKGSAGGLSGVPIQALWSNKVGGPYFPPGFTPQMPKDFRY